MVETTDRYRFDFPLQPETLIEAAERLVESDDAYDRFLAAELKDGIDRCEADLSDYRDVYLTDGGTSGTHRPESGECPNCGTVSERAYESVAPDFTEFDCRNENCRCEVFRVTHGRLS